MEREKFSGNLLNQNKGFGRIEPGLRFVYHVRFIYCFNTRVFLKLLTKVFSVIVQFRICVFWSCRKFFMCTDFSCLMIC